MKNDTIKISKIVKNVSPSTDDSNYAVCWVKDEIKGVEIDGVLYPNISNSIFFLDNKVQWKLYVKHIPCTSFYLPFNRYRSLIS